MTDPAEADDLKVSIAIRCPNKECARVLRVKRKSAGRTAPCPACKKPIRIPPLDSDAWKATPQQADNYPPDLPKETANSLGLRLRLIPAGKFMMGSDHDRDTEKPSHEVRITRPLYMGVTPVTKTQYRELMGKDPSRTPGDDNPVEQVTWLDTQRFCNKLSKNENKKYRLPTEAEWEYACRAGTTSEFYFGDDENSLGEYAWYVRNSDEHPHAVGLKKPNAWGLYDMLGNVWEWCHDWYLADYYSQSPGEDPKGPGVQKTRCLRGGSYINRPESCRCSTRSSGDPATRIRANGGFRVVLEIER